MTKQNPPGGTPNRPLDPLPEITDAFVAERSKVAAELGAASRSEQSAACPEPPPGMVEALSRVQGVGCGNIATYRPPAAEVGAAAKIGDPWRCRFCDALQDPPPDHRAAWERELGRSDSGRPPATVASADPELAALLAEALPHVERRARDYPDNDPKRSIRMLIAKMRSALSRLAGQNKDKPK